eukprot:3025222-Rhodomonas_salina.1
MLRASTAMSGTLASISLRACYAMSGTELAYGTKVLPARPLPPLNTEPAYPSFRLGIGAFEGGEVNFKSGSSDPGSCLRACYAMSGTDLAHGAVGDFFKSYASDSTHPPQQIVGVPEGFGAGRELLPPPVPNVNIPWEEFVGGGGDLEWGNEKIAFGRLSWGQVRVARYPF